jgi:peptidoglycan/xylan/chitin deacetylase (PgdA/CDA1 family)
MRAFNFPALPPGRWPTGKAKTRARIVLVLTAILAMLGSITSIALSATAHGSHVPVHMTTTKPITKPGIVNTPVYIPTHNAAPSYTSPHTHPLSYPLFYGNTHLPEVALTFDDGPNPYYTPQVLAILRHYGVQATFFDVGYLVKDFPNIVRQEYNNGNLVANHSWSHPELTLLSASAILSQLTSTSNAIQTTIGVRPTFFRPPYGAFNRTVLAQASYLGVTTVLWNDTAEDWTLPGVGFIVNRILSLAHAGAIILLHDGGGNRAQTVAALPTIITDLENRGFSLVTLQRLVDDLAVSTSQSAYSSTLSNTAFSTGSPPPLANQPFLQLAKRRRSRR